MKQFFLLFFLFGLTSCGTTEPIVVNTGTSTQSGINFGWVQISDSGTSVSSDIGKISVTPDGTVNLNNNQGTITAWKDGASARTNTQTLTGNNAQDIQNDAEVQKITEDINKIFADIAQEEKN